MDKTFHIEDFKRLYKLTPDDRIDEIRPKKTRKIEDPLLKLRWSLEVERLKGKWINFGEHIDEFFKTHNIPKPF